MPAASSLSLDPSDPDHLQRLFAPIASCRAVGVAVSGGADSLALMLMLARWRAARPDGPALHVYSVDHGFRPAAADEVSFVLDEAKKLGLDARGLKLGGEKPRTGVQEYARLARYRLMGAAMVEDGAEILLTAHHRADQAETVMMRLAHGSGLEGLKGMTAHASIEDVPIFRPLLDVDPQTLRRIVDDAGIAPIIDPSNADETYERVRWRKLMPKLAEFGLDAPGLSRFAARMAEADAALSDIARAGFEDMVRLDGFGSARIERRAYTSLSPAIATRILGRVLNIVGGRQKPRALGQVERLHQILIGTEAVKSTTVLGCVTRTDDDAILIAREPGRETPADRPLAPNNSLVWDKRFLISNTSSDSFVAGVADFLPRHRLVEFLGFKVTAPAEAIRTAPIVRDGSGTVAALGGWSFDPRIAVQLLID